MVIKQVNLETVCGITSKIPANTLGEVAFAGKSNVGKSSLINGLLNRKSLARISAQPGKTQTINFYNVNDALYLVDLPGYGYARAAEEIKAQWGQMIENYLHTSRMLKAVFLLVDIRHDPSENDALMYEWMTDQGFAPIIIATKADKVKPSQIKGRLEAIARTLDVAEDTVLIPFSAMTMEGRDEIWKITEELLFPEGIPDSCRSAAELRKEQDAAKAEELRRTQTAATDGGAGSETGDKNSQGKDPAAAPRKERWKKTGRPTAKKTAEARARKKSRR